MSARILAVLAAPLCLALSMGGCSSADAEPVEETAAEQEAVGVRPVDPSTGQPLNPVTLQPMDDNPLGTCTYVCSLSKRWVTMSNGCKPGAVCDPDVSNQECTQETTKSVFGDMVCPRVVSRGCINPKFPLP